VDQGFEKTWIVALLSKCIAMGQDRHRIMRVQRFLMACDHPEIPDPVIVAQLLAKQTHCIFDKNWICACLLYTSPSPRDRTNNRMPKTASKHKKKKPQQKNKIPQKKTTKKKKKTIHL